MPRLPLSISPCDCPPRLENYRFNTGSSTTPQNPYRGPPTTVYSRPPVHFRFAAAVHSLVQPLVQHPAYAGSLHTSQVHTVLILPSAAPAVHSSCAVRSCAVVHSWLTSATHWLSHAYSHDGRPS